LSLLKNIRVLDLTRFVAGPHCALVLSDLGAEIIKIEKPEKGDDLRIIGPKLANISLWAAVLNRGKKSLSLDLKSEEGRKIFLKLVKSADVVLENFRPGVMEKLRLDWNTLKKVNKKIIMARISGYGQNDSTVSRQAFDATIQAETGYMHISGHDNKPTMIGTVFLDYTTGLNTAIGILAAINSRNLTGQGELIETSLVSSALSLSMGAVPDFFTNKKNFLKNGNSDRFSSPSNTYKTKNGYIHIMAGSDDRFYGLVNAMNKKELFTKKIYNTPQKRIKNQKSLDKIINKWTKKNTIRVISKKLSNHNVPWGQVKTFGDFLKTKTAKNFITNAKIDDKIIKVPKCAIEVPKKNSNEKSIVPKVGQDNNKILKFLGYARKKIDVLKKKKII
tara:strand:+ start:734 stop:1903 length:1170 start_codon:yes stop_codon:yes gene_type:complete